MFLNTEYIQTTSRMIDFLSREYPIEVVQKYLSAQKKWWWIGYVLVPLIIIIKILATTILLNFVKLFNFSSLEKLTFSNLFRLVLLGEVVFIIVGVIKFVHFYWVDTNSSLEGMRSYQPLSIINYFEPFTSSERWLIYPLQQINLFEVLYWLILSFGIYRLSDKKISLINSFVSVL